MSWPALTPNEQSAGFRSVPPAVRVPGALAGSRLVGGLADDAPGPSRARLARLIRQVRAMVAIVATGQIATLVALLVHVYSPH